MRLGIFVDEPAQPIDPHYPHVPTGAVDRVEDAIERAVGGHEHEHRHTHHRHGTEPVNVTVNVDCCPPGGPAPGGGPVPAAGRRAGRAMPDHRADRRRGHEPKGRV
jgi:hypothetical protein